MWHKSIVGQGKIVNSLHESITRNNFSHATIIEGPSGFGGLPIALSTAQHLLCINQGSTPCGTCKSCVQVTSLIHPDLHIAFPVVKKEGLERKNTTAKNFMPEWRKQVIENPYLSYNEWIRSIVKTSANGDINARECNDIIQQLNLQAFSGERKVQIIWIADRLGNNGNKLLKLIEEPPPGTFIILVCDQLESLLATITSRCRVIRLPSIHETDVVDALVQHLEIDPKRAQQIGFVSDGNFSQALEFAHLDQNNLIEIILQWLDICIEGDIRTMRKWSVDFSKYNIEEQKAILHYMLKIVQAILYYQLMGEQAIKLSDHDKAQLLSSKKLISLSVDKCQDIISLVNKMIVQLERYVNSRMVMFDASLNMWQIFS